MEEKESKNIEKNILNEESSRKEKANVPNLRFPEFKLNWKKTSIGKCAESLVYGMNTPAVNYDGINKYIRITDIDEETSRFIPTPLSSPKGPLDSKYLVTKNDILFARTGASVGKSYIYDQDDGRLYFAGFLIKAKIKKEYNSSFIFYQTKTTKYKKWVRLISMRSGQPGINSQEYASYSIYLPNIDEQNRISSFLMLIDKRISTQNKIIEDLEWLKQSICYTIFIKAKTVGKKLKLKDILYERKTYAQNNGTYPHATLSKDGVSAKTERYDRDFLVKDIDKNYKITYKNDICYNPANLKFGVICLNTYGTAIFSPIYVTYEIKKQFDPYYISLHLTSNSFIQYIRKYEQGTVYERMAVNSDDFLKGEIYVPDYKEQLKYSKICRQIEKKIEIEKDILDAYKKQKAYLLQNMFI